MVLFYEILAFINLFTFSIAFTPLIVSYTVEILPYHIRAKGFNIFNFVISTALIFNQYVNPIALEHLTWRYYVCLYILRCILRLSPNVVHPQIVYVCWLLFELVFLYFTIIETKNLSLEETAVLFDGETVIEQIAGKAAHEIGDSPTDTSIDEKGSGSYGAAELTT